MAKTKVRVVNDLGEDVTPNGVEVGEIIVNGNGVTQNEKEINKGTVVDWLHTGDMGTIDEDGRINVVDRKKDHTGKNISTAEIESVLSKHPAVQEIAVIVTPHKELGETSHAIVVPNEAYSIAEQELIDFAGEKLSASNCPESVTFMEELPKTASGKILKVQLHEML